MHMTSGYMTFYRGLPQIVPALGISLGQKSDNKIHTTPFQKITLRLSLKVPHTIDLLELIGPLTFLLCSLYPC